MKCEIVNDYFSLILLDSSKIYLWLFYNWWLNRKLTGETEALGEYLYINSQMISIYLNWMIGWLFISRITDTDECFKMSPRKNKESDFKGAGGVPDLRMVKIEFYVVPKWGEPQLPDAFYWIEKYCS